MSKSEIWHLYSGRLWVRNPSLRQLEALVAVIEAGTVSGAAEMLRISQPAASKLIRDLEADTGLELFERESGRLVPTGRGMRLYEEVERIFGGVNQLARAVEAIRREERGQIVVGVMPGLSGPLMRRALAAFRQHHAGVFVQMVARSSQYLADAVMLRRLDLAVIVSGIDHPSLEAELLRSSPMVCALPRGHPLARLKTVTVREIGNAPFVSFAGTSQTRRKVEAAFEAAGERLNVVIEANTAPNVAEFVAGGFGLTVAPPMLLESVAGRIEMRPFCPELEESFTILRPRRARNSALVTSFIEALHQASTEKPRRA
jgi:DNA-binding transcriptional LysR family regulator